MPRAATPSFIAEFPLAVTRQQGRVLCNRFKAACGLYNGVLGEALRRAGLMRADPAWAAARAMKALAPEQRKARSAAFAAVTATHGFREYDLQKYAETMRDRSWLRHHLGSHDTQTTARRAFRAVADWVYKGRGRPRFKPVAQFSSIEGKSNDAVIRFRDGVVHWNGLELPIVRDQRDKYDFECHALACRTKYVRVVRRNLNGRMRYYAQLIQEGQPPKRERPLAKEGVGGLDLGPSMIAVFAPGKAAALIPLAPEIEAQDLKIKGLQRKMDSSRRATNPDNFNADGTVKPGRRKWTKSGNYRQLRDAKAELERRLQSERKRAHGELTNQLLSLCPVWKTEKLSYRAWQKQFGRSVGRRAPSLLLSTLARKAASAGGRVEEFPTRSTRLSQFDHTTGRHVKKPLSQRVHVFGDGQTQPVQRDLYSAFLAAHVRDDQLDTSQVCNRWPGAEPLLQQPVFELPPIRERKSRKGRAPAHAGRADRLSKAAHVSASAASHPGAIPRLAENPIPLRNGVAGTVPVLRLESPGFSRGEVQCLGDNSRQVNRFEPRCGARYLFE